MTEQNEKKKKKHGDPMEALQLAQDLMTALKKSESFINGRHNTHVMLDVMMGIALFTEEVLCAMEKASKDGFDYHDFYINQVMKELHPSVDSIVEYTANSSEEFLAS